MVLKLTLPPVYVAVNMPPTAWKSGPMASAPPMIHIATSTPAAVPSEPRRKRPIMGSPALSTSRRLTGRRSQKMASGATYPKMPS